MDTLRKNLQRGIREMKIIRVCSFFYPVRGGMENHLFNITKELVKLGNEVTVYTSNSTREDKLKPGIEITNKVKIIRFNTWFMLTKFSPLFPFAYLKTLTADYDVLHVNSFRQFHNLNLILAKLRNKKTVLGIHWPEYPKEVRTLIINLIIPLFDKTLGKLILKCSDKLIVQSNEEKQWLTNKFKVNANKIEIIPPGIEKDYLKLRDKNKFRKKYKIKGNLVLYLGRIHKSKGVDKIIKISKEFQKTTFVIAGSGPELKELKRIASKNIIFTGEVSEEEKLEALASCDIFIHPTNYDAFGITILEAYAQKKPVLASNIGGVPSAVGKGGLLFDKDNLEDLKEKVKKLLSSPKLRKELGVIGRKQVESLTWDKIAKLEENVYKK